MLDREGGLLESKQKDFFLYESELNGCSAKFDIFLSIGSPLRDEQIMDLQAQTLNVACVWRRDLDQAFLPTERELACGFVYGLSIITERIMKHRHLADASFDLVCFIGLVRDANIGFHRSSENTSGVIVRVQAKRFSDLWVLSQDRLASEDQQRVRLSDLTGCADNVF